MWPVVGHDWAVRLLANSLAEGRVSHAYLFIGPHHIGKTTMALSLAQALNCTGEERPCGECLSCQRIKRGIHPDLRLVDLEYQRWVGESEGDSRLLGIEAIRTILGEAALTPFEGKWKAFIIPEAERMTPEAANCLLKTLEEPPSQVVLLLTALHSGLLFPTIVSRCQIFNLRLVAIDLIREELERRWGLEERRAALLASLSAGRIGWAISAAQDGALLERREGNLNELLSLPQMSRLERLAFAERLSREPQGARESLELWLGWWRDLLLVKGGCPERVENVDRREILAREASGYSIEEIEGFVAAIWRTIDQLDDNINLRLALEVLLLDLPGGR